MPTGRDRLSVAVVTPTVAARRQTREATLGQWRALGFEPLVVEQAESVPLGHASQRRTAHAAIGAGLDSGAELILYAEDDIDLDPHLARMLPALPGRGPVSLWHRPRFEPRRPPARGPDQILIVPAASPARWFGALCVALTRRQAQALLAADYGRGGVDMDLRLLPGLRITLPSLVAHRDLPRRASRGPHIDCADYAGPRTQDGPPC